MDLYDVLKFFIAFINKNLAANNIQKKKSKNEIEKDFENIKNLYSEIVNANIENKEHNNKNKKHDKNTEKNTYKKETIKISHQPIEVDTQQYGISTTIIGSETDYTYDNDEYQKMLEKLKKALNTTTQKRNKKNNSITKTIQKAEQKNEEPFAIRAEEIKKIFENLRKKPKTDMVYFVMYDIESNKIRPKVAKYLEEKGLTRIQKSIFLGQTKQKEYLTIRKVLTELQQSYTNTDSIIIVPVPEDLLKTMYLIGRDIDFEITLNRKVTVFI